MELVSLYSLINNLEYGTDLHIGVVFLGGYGKGMCELPHEHTIHSTTVCEHFKKIPKGWS